MIVELDTSEFSVIVLPKMYGALRKLVLIAHVLILLV